MLTQTIPMWQKKIHSLSFWFSQEQRFSRRWATWASPGGPSFAAGLTLETQDAGDRRKVVHFKHLNTPKGRSFTRRLPTGSEVRPCRQANTEETHWEDHQGGPGPHTETVPSGRVSPGPEGPEGPDPPEKTGCKRVFTAILQMSEPAFLRFDSG